MGGWAKSLEGGESLGPWIDLWGPKRLCKPGNGKTMCTGPLHYKKHVWPVVVITILEIESSVINLQMILAVQQASQITVVCKFIEWCQ